MEIARRNTIRLAVVGLCVALAGCSRSNPTPGGGSHSNKAEKARKDAESLALSGVTGGAAAQAKAVPEVAARRGLGFNVAINRTQPGAVAKGVPAVPDPPPAPAAKGPPEPRSTPRSGWVIREHVVSSIPYTSEAEADEDALALALDLVERKLAALDPPLKHKPSPAEVKTDFLRKDSRKVRPPDAAEKEVFAPYVLRPETLVYVEFDVEVTADQVRELRTQERVSAGMRVMGALIAVALAGFLFLRADERTKGYLTRWLALAAVTLAGGIAAALLLA